MRSDPIRVVERVGAAERLDEPLRFLEGERVDLDARPSSPAGLFVNVRTARPSARRRRVRYRPV